MKINIKNICQAEVRYFDLKNNGLEYTPALSHVILFNRGDTYINLLNCGDFAPVFRRMKNKSNVYNNQDEYIGTKIELVCGEVQDGESWLISKTDFSDVFVGDEVDMRDIENYVLSSDLFFKDRLALTREFTARHGLPSLTIRNIVKKDSKDLEKMNAFFAEREKQKINKK